MALGRRDEGVASFNRSVELNPEHLHGWHGLGNALGANDDLVGAEAAFRKALALIPAPMRRATTSARPCSEMGKMDEAVEAFTEALRQRRTRRSSNTTSGSPCSCWAGPRKGCPTIAGLWNCSPTMSRRTATSS